MTKPVVQVMWSVKGCGDVWLNGQFRAMPADHVAVYLPGDHFEVRTRDNSWELRWWTLDGPLCRDVTESLGIHGPWPRQAGECPTARLDQLMQALESKAPAHEQDAALIVFRLMQDLGRRLAQPVVAESFLPLVQRCRELISAHYTDPSLDVTELARRLGVHRVHLSRTYHQATGATLISALREHRLQHAINLIRESTLPINEIAAATGHTSPAYFARVIAKATGYSPSDLRRLWQL